MWTRTLVSLLLFVSLLLVPVTTRIVNWPVAAGAQTRVPAPADALGFTPGDDRKLASWSQVIDYFERLDRSSERVKFETLGKTSMGKPFVMATISSPENMARLDEYRQIQDQLADPRKLGPAATRDRKAAQLIARGKTVVVITCGIHSTEVGSYLSSMLIAHRLASSNEPEIQNILKNTIVLLVPSLNPDGVDIVKNWYDKTLGTPYEGTEPPELYHKYTGHDDNRDWYAFTQVETQITVDKIHNVWHPQIVHDIHQQGGVGSRLFLPPYMKPVEPNVPKQIVEGYTELGYAIAKEMRAKGFQGITTDSTYDAWTPARAYSHYHGGVRILSETASARIATPVTLKFEELRSREGYDPQKETPNFGPVWRGGDWHLRDITNYMTTAAMTLLNHAAQNREQWLKRFYAIGKEAVAPITGRNPAALIIPPSANQGRLISILQRGGVEVDTARPFKYRGENFEEFTAIVKLDQPYGSFAKALLETQRYPDLRDATGHPIAPYDVTAHSLAVLMNVKVVPAPTIPLYRVSQSPRTLATIAEPPDINIGLYKASLPSMDEGWTRWLLEDRRVRYESLNEASVRKGNLYPQLQTIVIPDQAGRSILNGYRSGAMPDEYTGGLGQDGVKALRDFVEKGGTLVCLNRASDFAVDQFKLPLRNVVSGLPRTEFYVPGSILRIEVDTTQPVARNMPHQSIAWAEDSPVYEVTNEANATVPAANIHVIAWYPKDKDPLLSGWLLGGDRIKGKAALIEVKLGKGRIVLFGFRPQFRAQSLATYPLFFNSLSLD